MEELLLAATLKQQLDALRPIDPEQENKIMQKFRLDWNYHSNNLEGNSLTYGETKALLLFGVTAQGKPLKDHFEVTGHNEAINMVIDVVNGDYPLSQNFIRELHTLLLKKPYQVDAETPDGQPTKKWVKVGEYKASPNHVKTKTGEMFYFATPEETPSKMADLIDWYNERIVAAGLNPILLAAEFHYKFIRIHPFDDGNGRTARILMNFILMKFGYPPVIIKTEDKENYFAALRLADVGEIEAFITYIAINLVRSLDIMLAGARGESIEEPDDIDKEIALLERKLIYFETNKVAKSKEIVIGLISNSLQSSINKFIVDISKISKLYKESDFSISVGDEKFYSTVEEYFDRFTEDISEINLIKNIDINFYFSNLKQIGFEEVYFSSGLQIYFDINTYSINLNDDIDPIIQKSYTTNITKLEIDRIIWGEIQRHTAFIEQKIAEKENGQS